MKIFWRSSFVCLLTAFILAGFKKKTSPINDSVPNVTLVIFFDNVAGKQDIKLDDINFVNAAGETFTVTQLQYFVSNIRLGRTDGTEYIIPPDSSYFLIQENIAATQQLKLKVPEGEYNRLSFVLGVDSVRNTMDISQRTGVLDPASSMDNGMYWGWNSGYIFFKMEGNSTAAPADPIGRQKFRYHIGGFGGYSAPTINNIRTIPIDLSKEPALPRKDKVVKVHIKADVLNIFNGTTNVSIAAHPSVMFSEYSVNIANNYSKMFSHHLTEN